MNQAMLDKVTDKFISLLEVAIEENKPLPWAKPWADSAPKNFVTKKPYRGFNAILLSLLGGSQYWLSFKQAKDLGGAVKKGEKGTPIIFWSTTTKKEGEEEKTIFFSKYYTVFNLDQCEGIDLSKLPKELEFNPIEKADSVIEGYLNRPEISFGGDRAFYRPSTDSITMPPQKSFVSEHEYYSTLFHELVHSTGHKDRLNRKEINENHGFGSHNYSKEELCAEFGAMLLCSYAGISTESTEKNSIAYLKGWLTVLKNDRSMIVSASQQAQKAVDCIIGTNFDK